MKEASESLKLIIFSATGTFSCSMTRLWQTLAVCSSAARASEMSHIGLLEPSDADSVADRSDTPDCGEPTPDRVTDVCVACARAAATGNTTSCAWLLPELCD